jgi:Arc/MetJ-type ribon-helix-helix transcriptional regulator
MTRMRTIGLLGITAVIVGFVLVVWKIVRGRGFVWLINRQLWTPAAAIFLYAVLPVDFLVHTYNVRRILKGDLAPSVQISVHPIDSGGILALYPLMKSDDEAIREGIKAMLAERALRAEYIERERALQNWTSFQLADRLLLKQLRELTADWSVYADANKRQAALQRYREYAYQWY